MLWMKINKIVDIKLMDYGNISQFKGTYTTA